MRKVYTLITLSIMTSTHLMASSNTLLKKEDCSQGKYIYDTNVTIYKKDGIIKHSSNSNVTLDKNNYKVTRISDIQCPQISEAKYDNKVCLPDSQLIIKKENDSKIEGICRSYLRSINFSDYLNLKNIYFQTKILTKKRMNLDDNDFVIPKSSQLIREKIINKVNKIGDIKEQEGKVIDEFILSEQSLQDEIKKYASNKSFHESTEAYRLYNDFKKNLKNSQKNIKYNTSALSNLIKADIFTNTLSMNYTKKSKIKEACQTERMNMPTINLGSIAEVFSKNIQKIEENIQDSVKDTMDDLVADIDVITSDESVINYAITGITWIVAKGVCSSRAAMTQYGLATTSTSDILASTTAMTAYKQCLSENKIVDTTVSTSGTAEAGTTSTLNGATTSVGALATNATTGANTRQNWEKNTQNNVCQKEKEKVAAEVYDKCLDSTKNQILNEIIGQLENLYKAGQFKVGNLNKCTEDKMIFQNTKINGGFALDFLNNMAQSSLENNKDIQSSLEKRIINKPSKDIKSVKIESNILKDKLKFLKDNYSNKYDNHYVSSILKIFFDNDRYYNHSLILKRVLQSTSENIKDNFVGIRKTHDLYLYYFLTADNLEGVRNRINTVFESSSTKNQTFGTLFKKRVKLQSDNLDNVRIFENTTTEIMKKINKTHKKSMKELVNSNLYMFENAYSLKSYMNNSYKFNENNVKQRLFEIIRNDNKKILKQLDISIRTKTSTHNKDIEMFLTDVIDEKLANSYSNNSLKIVNGKFEMLVSKIISKIESLSENTESDMLVPYQDLLIELYQLKTKHTILIENYLSFLNLNKQLVTSLSQLEQNDKLLFLRLIKNVNKKIIKKR